MREKEINLVDFIIEILMHWRGMILMMLAGALLLGGFSYVRSIPKQQGQEEETDTSVISGEEITLAETIQKCLTDKPEDLEAAISEWFGRDLPDLIEAVREELEKELTEEQLSNVAYVLYYEALYNDKKSFQEESVLQQMDLDHIQRSELIFLVTAGDLESAYNLEKVYEDFVNSSELLSALSQKSGISVSALAEIFWLSRSSGSLLEGTDTFKVSILHDDEAICQALSDAVVEYIGQKHRAMSEKWGEHDITLLSRSIGTIGKLSILSTQREIQGNLLSLQNNCISRKTAFSEEEWYYYHLLTKGIISGNPYDKPNDRPAAKPDGAPGISLKQVVLGMVLALFIYLFAIFIHYILNKRLRPTDQLAELYHISQLGHIPGAQTKQKAFGAIDQAILSLRYGRQRKFNGEEALKLAIAASKLAARANALSAIGLIGCELKGQTLKDCESIQDALGAAGIQVLILNNVLYDGEAMEKLTQLKGVILVEKAGASLYAEIAQELELLQRQGIAVLGGIVAE